MKHLCLSLLLLAITRNSYSQQVDWAFGIGGTSTDVIKAVETDQNGNTFIAGEIRSLTVDFDPGAGVNLQSTSGNDDVFIAKYDIDGALLWVNVLPSTGFSSAQDIAIDSLGDVYVTGNFNGEMNFDQYGSEVLTSGLQGDAYVAKYYGGTGFFKFAFNIVGEGPSIGIGIELDQDASIYVAGTMSDSAYFNPYSGGNESLSMNPGGFFLVKYLTNIGEVGAYPYIHWVFGINALGGADVKDIDVTPSGDVVLTGAFEQEIDLGSGNTFSSDEIDSYIMKVNTLGNPLWGHVFTGNLNQIALGTDINANGEVYVCGDFTSEIDLDPTSGTDIVSNQPTQSAFVTKLAANGDYLWGRAVLNQGDGKFIEIDQDFLDASVFVTGTFNGTITLPDASLIYSTGGSDILSVKYDSSGVYEEYLIFGGTTNDAINTGGVSVYFGDLIIGGHYYGTIDFGPGTAVHVGPVSQGQEDIFLAKYTNVTSVPDIISDSFSFYPNPVKDNLYLSADKNWSTFVVYDLIGRTITSGINSATNVIKLTDLSSGTYLLQFLDENEAVYQGFVVKE